MPVNFCPAAIKTASVTLSDRSAIGAGGYYLMLDGRMIGLK